MSFHWRYREDSFQELMPGCFFVRIVWNDRVCLHILHFTLLAVTVAFRVFWRGTKQYKADTSWRSGYQCSWRLVCQKWWIFLDHFNGGLAVSVASGCWMLSRIKSLFNFSGENHKIHKYNIQLQMPPHPKAFIFAGIILHLNRCLQTAATVLERTSMTSMTSDFSVF